MASDPPFTTSDFEDAVQRQLVPALAAALRDVRLDPGVAETLLDKARALCRSDFLDGGARLRILGQQAEGDGVAEAEEAYLALSVHDRDDGHAWLAQSYWLSDLVIGSGDPAQVRTALAGLERTAARLRDWLADAEDEAAQPDASQ